MKLAPLVLTGRGPQAAFWKEGEAEGRRICDKNNSHSAGNVLA
jgi:hypothetical protein